MLSKMFAFVLAFALACVFAASAFNLEMYQTVERNRCRYLTLHECIHVAHVARDHGDKPERAAGVAPCQAPLHPKLATIADTRPASGAFRPLCVYDGLNHPSLP